MNYPLINISDTELEKYAFFDVMYNSDLLINKNDLKTNFINRLYFDSIGHQFQIKDFVILKKEWNPLFLLSNNFKPLVKAKLIFERKDKKITIEKLKEHLIERVDKLGFISTEERKLEVIINLQKSTTFKELIDSVALVIDEE